MDSLAYPQVVATPTADVSPLDQQPAEAQHVQASRWQNQDEQFLSPPQDTIDNHTLKLIRPSSLAPPALESQPHQDEDDNGVNHVDSTGDESRQTSHTRRLSSEVTNRHLQHKVDSSTANVSRLAHSPEHGRCSSADQVVNVRGNEQDWMKIVYQADVESILKCSAV